MSVTITVIRFSDFPPQWRGVYCTRTQSRKEKYTRTETQRFQRYKSDIPINRLRPEVRTKTKGVTVLRKRFYINTFDIPPLLPTFMCNFILIWNIFSYLKIVLLIHKIKIGIEHVIINDIFPLFTCFNLYFFQIVNSVSKGHPRLYTFRFPLKDSFLLYSFIIPRPLSSESSTTSFLIPLSRSLLCLTRLRLTFLRRSFRISFSILIVFCSKVSVFGSFVVNRTTDITGF